MKIGFFSGALAPPWTDHIWPPEQAVEIASAAGFGAIEWEMRKNEGHIRMEAAVEDAVARRAQSHAAGLTVCCISAHPTLSLLDESCIAALCAAATASEAPLIRLMPPPFDANQPVDRQLDALRAVLQRHADSYATHGVTLTVEMVRNTLVPSPELMRRVCDGLDARAVGALYDPGNLVAMGNLAPDLALAILGEYLKHVHMKNLVFIRRNDAWTTTLARADEGLVNWHEVFSALHKRDYAGWVVIDHIYGGPSLDGAQADRELAESLWRTARGDH